MSLFLKLLDRLKPETEAIVIFGDETILTERGVRVDPKVLQMIGISDKSLCWGTWIWPPEESKRRPHLLISAIHPDSWPVAFRLSVELQDKPGALKAATEALVRESMNILFAECTPSGYKHATWNVIGEWLAAKDHFRALRNDSPDVRKRASYVHAFAVNAVVRNALLRAHEEHDFIRSRFVSAESLYGPLEEHSINESLNTLGLDQGLLASMVAGEYESIDVPGLRTYPPGKLGYVWAVSKSFMEFSFSADHRELRALDEESFAEALELKRPLATVASLDTTEFFLRVIVPDEAVVNRRFRVHLPYQVRFHGAPSDRQSTLGLLAHSCRQLENRKVNLRRVSNSLRSRNNQTESGVLSFLGVLDAESVNSLDETLDELVSAVSEVPAEFRSESRTLSFGEEALAQRYSPASLFISTRFDDVDWKKKMIPKIERAARRAGLNPVTRGLSPSSEASETAIKEEVSSHIRGASAFLQIIPLFSRDESPKDIDLRWLIFEYGMAVMTGVPVRVLVAQESFKKVPPLDEWMKALPFRQGGTFNTFDAYRLLENASGELDEHMRYLANECYFGSEEQGKAGL